MMPRIESLSPEHRFELKQLELAWRQSPADLVQTRDGFYFTFDTWLAHVLPFRLRPTRAHLAVGRYVNEVLYATRAQ
jgi:hypothetical protein